MVNRKKIMRLRVKREGRPELDSCRGLHFCKVLVEKARDNATPAGEIPHGTVIQPELPAKQMDNGVKNKVDVEKRRKEQLPGDGVDVLNDFLLLSEGTGEAHAD